MIYAWNCWRKLFVCSFACVGSSLHTYPGLMCTQVYSCEHRPILEAMCTWVLAYVPGALSAYVGLDPRTWDAWQIPYFAHFHLFFNCFNSICNPNTFIFCHFCTWTLLHPYFYLYSCIKNIIFHIIFFFCSPHSLMLVGEAPTRWWSGTTSLFSKPRLTSRKWASSLSLFFYQKILEVLLWCNASSRGGGILLIPSILLSKEMTVTSYDFHHMTGLSFERAIINLDSVLGIQLGLDMLGKKYPIETIRYFYLVLD